MIDISAVAKGKEDEYLRHLSDLCSCPCTRCTARCEETCIKYHLWQENKFKERELREKRRNYRKTHGNQK